MANKEWKFGKYIKRLIGGHNNTKSSSTEKLDMKPPDVQNVDTSVEITISPISYFQNKNLAEAIVTENFHKHFDGLINELCFAEQEQKNAYYAAIEIEDVDKATSVITASRANHRQIKKWIDELLRSRNEIINYCNEYRSKLYPTLIEITHIDEQPKTDDVITQFISDDLIHSRYDETITDDVTKHNETKDLLPESVSFNLLGKIFTVRSWSDVLANVCEEMILKKPYEAARLTELNELYKESHTCFSFIKLQENESVKLSNGLYIYTGCNSTEVCVLARCILKQCGYNHKDFNVLVEGK